MTTLRFVSIYIFTLHCHGQPVFDCPKPVGYGESSNLTCSNLKEGSGSISNPAGTQVTSCFGDRCHVDSDFREKKNASIVQNMILLNVHKVNQTDEGEWTCQSGNGNSKCSLNVYKHPSCNVTSSTTTKNLTIGQEISLTINLSDYYCTNSIAWNLQIGGESKNITEFREVEKTDIITDRVVTYSPTVTSSLTGPVKLTFNCNDETYDVSCGGVEELKLRDPPHCTLSSEDDTNTLTIGNNLTLEAAIEEYNCTTGIKYALLSGSLMVTEFIRRDSIFSATFEVKPVYLNKQLHLKFTCNNVSATTRTAGVTILLTKDKQKLSINTLGLVIGLPVGVILLNITIGILLLRYVDYV